MLKQSLIVAKIKEQQCEAHLQIMRVLSPGRKSSCNRLQPPPVNQHTEWVMVATEAIRRLVS